VMFGGMLERGSGGKMMFAGRMRHVFSSLCSD
jgi:hypothetical protein